MAFEIEDEVRRTITRYARNVSLMERQMVTVEMMDDGPYEWSLPEFLAVIEGAVANIPEDRRASACVRVTASEYRPTFSISYERTETDEEMERRIRSLYASAKETEDRERRNYERLKKKFG